MKLFTTRLFVTSIGNFSFTYGEYDTRNIKKDIWKKVKFRNDVPNKKSNSRKLYNIKIHQTNLNRKYMRKQWNYDLI